MNKSKKIKKEKVKPLGKRKFNWFRFLTVLMVVAVGVELVIGATAVSLVQTMLKDEPTVDLDHFYTQETTIVYDRNGTVIADVGSQLRENITYDEIPESLVDAFLAIEDSRYFEHNGFDIPRFTKSVLNTLVGSTQGGSTFTMQLVKLTYFTDDEAGTSKTKDIEYKIQQIDLAMKLESKSSKQKIFEMYLNKMNFGGIGNIRGVEKASEQYFGKRVSELNIAESAMLAGVINSPYYYNPYTYLDHATKRRNEVLYQMLNHGYITKEQYTLAKSIKVEDLLQDPSVTIDNSHDYQAYIDYALQEAQSITGQDPLNVSMEIYTAMDPNVQTTMEEIQAGTNSLVSFPDELMEVGVIAQNNQNGEIIAIGGGRNYAAGGAMLLNHATAQYKQPGSSIKPFLDYAPTFDYLGWATDHELVDKAISYGTWTYQNAGGKYYGSVDLQYALSMSLNTPAIQAAQAVIDAKGYDWYVQYMKSLGFDTSVAENFDISYSIGGNNFVCTVEQLAAAHATIMNEGNYITPHTVTKIHFRSGNQPDIEPTYEETSVMSAQAAYMTATLMYGTVHGGIQNYLPILQRSYATYGKTGTTDWGDSGLQYGIPKGAMKDKWMVGETSQFTTAVWVGYEKAVAGEDTYFNNQKGWMNIPGKILSEVLDAIEVSYGTPAEVAQPDGLSQITHVKGIYPYVAVTDIIPDDYKTTGLIKSEYAKLGSFKESIPTLDNLSSFNATLNDDNSISFSWAAYPNAEQLEVKDNKETTFDISWITGKVIYKARIEQNGQTLGEVSSEENTLKQGVALAYDTETKVCGYYGYANTSDTSNEVCTTFKTGEDPNATKEEKYNATISKVDDNKITYSSNGTETELDVSNIPLQKNGNAATTSDLQVGNSITLVYVKKQLKYIILN